MVIQPKFTKTALKRKSVGTGGIPTTVFLNVIAQEEHKRELPLKNGSNTEKSRLMSSPHIGDLESHRLSNIMVAAGRMLALLEKTLF